MNPIRFEMEQPEPCNNWHDHLGEGNTLLDIADEGAGKYAILSCSMAVVTLAEFDEWAGKVRAAIKMGLGEEA